MGGESFLRKHKLHFNEFDFFCILQISKKFDFFFSHRPKVASIHR